MPIRGARTLTWRPVGITDTLDSTDMRPGSMLSLQNLIPAPTTRGLFVPRPASIQLPNTIGLGNAGVTVFLILGSTVYGMVSNGNGFDVPFIYNLNTQTSTVPSNITSSNTPYTQSVNGDWTPPTMVSLGAYVIVTHPGFQGPANGYIGWFDLTTPATPVWHSGNFQVANGLPSPNVLPSAPVAVAVYGGRAYYAVGNAVQASDEFLPLQQTNAGQVLTFGDSTPITALAGLPLNNVQGGIIQSLMVFKGIQNIFQVTGDYSGFPSIWTVNTLNVATGTLAPNTVTPTPRGLAFVAPDGVRLIDFSSNVSDPIGDWGTGMKAVFQNAVYPSRMCAAFNMQTLRISVQVAAATIQSNQEYWFNYGLKSWTGPHTTPTVFMRPYNNTFIAAFALPPS
jgi:hypothetical protein